ncbi:efflux RND transporter periplasmic adaptor subunit [Mucilaginibacter sp. Bleaf8]|uniref:efflux RND transporter periplasmic adaptor subunit n=1 Tax=Mucilaginibacter sp. Bleaf8 TaxID=2834430 RepID=UPI001BCF81C8|nr:efflux RND transporter periplasmic adaptor subunit [Mucilaginibacter sp. Bleaf8]MBS7564438.1 efflux RND transporter periplasmic adaptor subunit [Mucilaginibacter sp. Bleaf8]
MNNKYKFSYPVLIAALGIGIGALSACSSHPHEAPKDDKFQVTDTLLNSLLVDTVKAGNADALISLSGKITADDSKMAKIFPMVSGITQNVRVQMGDVVHKGQVLATMKSVEMAGFSKDVISADADIRNAKRNLQVAQDLYKSGLASEKDVEAARSDYQKAQAESNRSRTVLNINKGNAGGYEVISPISGTVIEKNVTSNSEVRADNNQNMFTVADLSTVWAMINIYESDIASIKTGDEVKITTLSYPDKVFTGRIDKVYSTIDPDNKVMQARVVINNAGNLLKPEMFASVQVQSQSGETLPKVNTRTLVFDNDRYYVVVIDGKAHARIQPVTIAKKADEYAYISSGLKPGDRVVASRQVFLYESLKD